MGAPQAQVEVYDAQTTDFATQPDPATLTSRLYNSEKSWSYGAFNESRVATNPFDYGWGVYSTASNTVVGSKVFVVKLRTGSYIKLQIVSLAVGGYTFKYANLNGTNEITKVINKADFAGKTFAYFSFAAANTVSVEPTTGFDMMYCRYSTPYPDPSTGQLVPYTVAGILHARGVKTAKALNITPATVSYNSFKDSLKTEPNTIGFDWKAFDGAGWILDQNRVYFLKTTANRVWKLQFIDFEGSSTGKAIMEKTDLGIFTAVENTVFAGLETLIYPNKVANDFNIALDANSGIKNATITVVDMQGRTVLNQNIAVQNGFQVFNIAADTFAAGAYSVQLIGENTVIHLGKIVKL
jgi:Secretion system C-terminal sorting domain